MVVLLKEHPDERQLNYLKNWLASMNIEARETQGEHQTILGLVGDTSRIDMDLIRALEIVEDVRRIQEPYQSANRKFHPLDTCLLYTSRCSSPVLLMPTQSTRSGS